MKHLSTNALIALVECVEAWHFSIPRIREGAGELIEAGFVRPIPRDPAWVEPTAAGIDYYESLPTGTHNHVSTATPRRFAEGKAGVA